MISPDIKNKHYHLQAMTRWCHGSTLVSSIITSHRIIYEYKVSYVLFECEKLRYVLHTQVYTCKHVKPI